MYTFDVIGVSPVLQFFNHQQDVAQHHLDVGIEYLSSYQCALDPLLESVEVASVKHAWDLDEVVDTVIHFWMNNAETIHYWKCRLADAGRDSLLVSRLADLEALKISFKHLL